MASSQSGGEFSGRVALVTGASRGIGAAVAKAFARRGATVIALGRDAQALKDTVISIRGCGGNASAKICNIASADGVAATFDEIRSEYGKVDILVNNAGLAGPTARIEAISVDAWREVIETNVTGTFLVTRSTLPLMSRAAVIINNLSIAAKTAFVGMGAYVAAKHAVHGFTLTLREELREQGIRVIAAVPGATDTGIWQQFWPEAPRDRMMSAETVAELMVMAASLPENASLDEFTITPASGVL